MPTIVELQQKFHQQNKDKGFYDYERDITILKDLLKSERNLLTVATNNNVPGMIYADELDALDRVLTDYRRAMLERKMLLVIGEICEAHEELRAGHAPTETYYNGTSPKPEGFPVEIADAAIRLMDLSGAADNNLQADMLRKDAYNQTRPHKHGKQF